MAQLAKKWILLKPFEETPKVRNFRMVEEAIMFNLKPGEIIVEAVFLSVDPYMRWTAEPGSVMPGQQVARVKISYNRLFPEGRMVLCCAGWRTLTLVPEPEAETPLGPMATLLPDDEEHSASLWLGLFGIPGMTAYFGMLDRGRPKRKETVLVSGAAGCVGSVAGQVAKNQGCTVIGSAGTNQKCSWLKDLGFDHVFNYKETSVDEALEAMAPKGIDLYFDNVGGDFSHAVLDKHMKYGGRVVVSGALSVYNMVEMKERSNFKAITYKQLDVLGVNFAAYRDRYHKAVEQMTAWMSEGKLQYRETLTQGFENMPHAFICLFRGRNTGKSIITI